MKNNKKPETTQISESLATRHLYDYLRLNKIEKFKNEDMLEKIICYYAEKLKEEESLEKNIKYYKYIYGHAKKQLKQDGILEENSDLISVYINPKQASDEGSNDKYAWETNITIKNVFEFIGNNKYVIPSFQRGTAWTRAKDYKELALSIYRQVPIGVMYLWQINKEKALEVGHYSFKEEIKVNDELNFKTIGINGFTSEEVYSVIDGQQRITGVNIIVNGSFNEKKLYFNEQEIGVDKFSFRKYSNHNWKSMQEIYNLLKDIPKESTEAEFDLKLKTISEELNISYFSLNMLYKGFFTSNLISVCKIQGGDLLNILDVFIRINNFGKKLRPADLMLSALTGNNKNPDFDIREKIKELTNSFRKFKENYSLAAILKLVSVFFTNDSKINHKTFDEKNNQLPAKFSLKASGWKTLNKSVNNVIDVLKELGVNPKNIASDNSLIPIIYWHSRNHNKKIVSDNQKNNISIYIIMIHLFKHFKSSTDQKLLDLIKQVEEDEEFEKWKIFKDPSKINISDIKNEIKNWEYGRDNLKIKTILSLNDNGLDGSDSIEHLEAQNRGGSNKIHNLALLPKSVNSLIQDKPKDEKIILLSKEYKKNQKEIKEALLLMEEDRIEKIAKMIIQKIT